MTAITFGTLVGNVIRESVFAIPAIRRTRPMVTNANTISTLALVRCYGLS